MKMIAGVDIPAGAKVRLDGGVVLTEGNPHLSEPMYELTILWDRQGKNRSPSIGPYTSTEADREMKLIRAQLRRSGRYFTGCVRKRVMARPGRWRGWSGLNQGEVGAFIAEPKCEPIPREVAERQLAMYEHLIYVGDRVVADTSKERTTMKYFDEMNSSERRNAATAFQRRHGYIPSEDSLRTFVNELAEEERAFVQVCFASEWTGGQQTYTYRVDPGEPVTPGDYLQVWSPLTDRHELVRVQRLGRGSWTGPTKTAKRIRVEVLD